MKDSHQSNHAAEHISGPLRRIMRNFQTQKTRQDAARNSSLPTLHHISKGVKSMDYKSQTLTKQDPIARYKCNAAQSVAKNPNLQPKIKYGSHVVTSNVNGGA